MYDSKESGVYKITNKENDKRYYGSSGCLEEKLKEEYQDLELGLHIIPELNKDVKKYGIEVFEIEIIYNCLEHETGEVVEVLANLNNALDRCYNKPSKIIKLTPEQKILFTTKEETGMSEEQKRKISKKLKGTKKSEETRSKISKAMKGKTYPEVKCPHCPKIGRGGAMKRFHFENCKEKA